MISVKFPNYIINLLLFYLQNRTLKVQVNSSLSNSFAFQAGVSQGSKLEPVPNKLFTVDISRLPKTTLAIFANDVAIRCDHRVHNNLKKKRMNITNKYFISNGQQATLFGYTPRSTPRLKVVNKFISWSFSYKHLALV